MSKLKQVLFVPIIKLIRKIQSLLGIQTIGVRAIVLNEQKQILLVKHSYSSGWYLPGGGVKSNESAVEGIIRELKEEAGIIVTTKPKLLAIYFHLFLSAPDYPVLYLVEDFTVEKSHSYEISEVAWFDYANLPRDISPSNKRRLDEYFLKLEAADRW